MKLFVLAALGPVSVPVVVGALIVIAIILGVGGFLLWRGGNKKKDAAADGGANAWQNQAQQAQGAWNQQGSAAGWGQQPQQAGWGAPQDPNNPWAAQAAQQQPQQAGWGQQDPNNPWAAQAAQQQPQQAGQAGWGQQDQNNPWAAQAAQQQPQQAGWGAQDQNNPWGTQAAQQQPQQQSPAWGGQQQPQTAYGSSPNQGWGQNQPQAADPWAAPAAAAPAANTSGPAWQQGGFSAQPSPAYGGSVADSDKTILRSTGPQQQGMLGVVRVEEGKEPGRIYEIRKESLSIGRSRDSDIFLEDLAVSRLHASILNMGNGNYALKDEGSANGTKINGQLLNKYQTQPLQDGDRIQLGQTVLVFARR